jgi:hypothetical protein
LLDVENDLPQIVPRCTIFLASADLPADPTFCWSRLMKLPLTLSTIAV